MNQRKCPYCGELVPTNALTCPKCFREIPRGTDVSREEYEINEDRKVKRNYHLVMILAVIPAFFGILGLGQIYNDYRAHRGYWFLLAGLVLYLPMIALILSILDSGILSAIFLFVALVIVFLIYASAAVAAFLDAVFGSVFKILRV